MENIIFIARTQFYRNKNTAVSNDFIESLTKSCKYNIHLFWDNTCHDHLRTEITRLSPKLIMIFDINNVSSIMKNFSFIYSSGIQIGVFLEDTYYITSNTGNCEYTKLANYLVFWYKNKSIIDSYERVFPGKYITNIGSRYVNTNMYNDYGMEKTCDILLYGTRTFNYPYKIEQLDSIQNYIKKYEQHHNTKVSSNTLIPFYPLRCKLEGILNKLYNKYRIRILPETSILDPAIQKIANEELSMLINQSYLTIACPGIADVMMHKFLEITASKSVILGKYPSDYKDLFEGNIIEVDEYMEDEQIIKIIDEALADKKKLGEMSERMYEKVHKEHNLDKATESFEQVIDEILFCK